MENQIHDDIKEDRYNRFMQKAQEISKLKLKEKVGKTYSCVVDKEEPDQLLCRSIFDAPEIDGLVYVPNNRTAHSVGDRIKVKIKNSYEYLSEIGTFTLGP